MRDRDGCKERDVSAATVRFDAGAKRPLMQGIDLVADLVATNIGPAGRAVLSSRLHTRPALLRGGYAIAKEAEFDQPGLRAGAVAMRQLAADVDAQAGDGTARALILARALLQGATRQLQTGISVPALREALLAHGAVVSGEIEAAARPVTDPAFLDIIAARAAGGDRDIGHLVARAHARAGAEGVVTIESGHGVGDELSVEAGMSFPQGWLSPHFLTDAEAQRIELANPLILLHQGPIDSFTSVARILEMIAQSGKQLLIVADSFDGEAMATLIANRQSGLKVAPMKAPGAGTWRALQLEDIAVATGATVIGAALGTTLNDLRPAMLGRAEAVRMARQATHLIGGKGSEVAISARCEAIRQQIGKEHYLAFDREQHQARLARFGAAIARLRIGGATETEIAFREARARSAAAALRASAAGGVVPGGAAALIHAGRRGRSALPAGEAGRAVGAVFTAALSQPLVAIAGNAGLEGPSIARLLENSTENQAFDVELRALVDGAAAPEPARILAGALRAAVSFAATFMAVEVSIST
nr:chaperonin GroEL [Ancylobacter sp. Lp-2]